MKADDFKKVWMFRTPDGPRLEAVDPDSEEAYDSDDHLYVGRPTELERVLPPGEPKECRVVPLAVLELLIEQAFSGP